MAPDGTAWINLHLYFWCQKCLGNSIERKDQKINEKIFFKKSPQLYVQLFIFVINVKIEKKCLFFTLYFVSSTLVHRGSIRTQLV